MSTTSSSGLVVPARHQPDLPLDRLIRTDPPDAEAVEMDVVFVGGGPAGLAGAIELARLVTKASCLSDSHNSIGLPNRVAQSLACWNNRPISAAVLDSNASANHTRFRCNSRTTYKVSCPFSGCRPSMVKTSASTPW